MAISVAFSLPWRHQSSPVSALSIVHSAGRVRGTLWAGGGSRRSVPLLSPLPVLTLLQAARMLAGEPTPTDERDRRTFIFKKGQMQIRIF